MNCFGISLCILLRRHADVKRDFDLWAGGIVIINYACLCHTLFQLIQVSGNQFAGTLVFLAVMRTGKLLFLGGQLARQTITGVYNGLVQVSRTPCHALNLTLLFEERGQ